MRLWKLGPLYLCAIHRHLLFPLKGYSYLKLHPTSIRIYRGVFKVCKTVTAVLERVVVPVVELWNQVLLLLSLSLLLLLLLVLLVLWLCRYNTITITSPSTSTVRERRLLLLPCWRWDFKLLKTHAHSLLWHSLYINIPFILIILILFSRGGYYYK